jgi:hypothetical protein
VTGLEILVKGLQTELAGVSGEISALEMNEI